MKTIICGITVCATVVSFNIQLPVNTFTIIGAGVVVLLIVWAVGLRNTNQY